jgi:hypothetical protein
MFSRYGSRQWAAPLPSTRIIMKDPFAVLSLRALSAVTNTVPVLLYRHPAAVLASYRRMGWTADTDEMTALGAPAPTGPGDLAAMAAMWGWCHQVALADLEAVPEAVIVSHQALTNGAEAAHAVLCDRLGLGLAPALTDTSAGTSSQRRDGVLHDFDRTAAAVATGWRERVAPDEIDQIESMVATVWSELESRQLRFPTAPLGTKEDPT